MSTYRRLRAVFQLALISAVCWGVVALIATLVAELVFGGDLSHWSPALVFLSSASLGLIAGAVFAVFLGLRRSVEEGARLSPRRSMSLGGLGGLAVVLVFRVFGPGEFEGLAVGSLLGIATAFSAFGALTGLSIQQVARRGVLPADTSSTKSIAP